MRFIRDGLKINRIDLFSTLLPSNFKFVVNRFADCDTSNSLSIVVCAITLNGTLVYRMLPVLCVCYHRYGHIYFSALLYE